MIRIVIADDHAVVRSGVRRILADETDIQPAGEASNSADLLDLLERTPCDLLLLDMSMPTIHGLDLIKVITGKFPNVHILILSMFPEDQYGVRALRAGAWGYMTKDCDADELLGAIRKVASGRKYISAELAELLEMELHAAPGDSAHSVLSDREFEVFRLIARGKTVSQIAVELALSVKTVSKYRARALSKMHMKSNADIMAYGYKTGLVA